MDETRRELLHEALEGNPGAQSRLAPLLTDPELQVTHERLARVQVALTGLPATRAPVSVAPAVLADIRAARALGALTAPPMPQGVASRVAARIAEDAHPEVSAALRALPRPAPPPQLAVQLSARIGREARRNPAPLVLVALLLASLAALSVNEAWPNLRASAVAVRAIMAQLSPLVFVGFTLLLIVSAVLSVRPPRRAAGQWGGALAFGLSALLVLPGLSHLFGISGGENRVRVGGNVQVSGRVPGNVIALGGDVVLSPGARVGGEVIAFLGDVQREPGARVRGTTSALLGRVVADGGGGVTVQTQPVSALGTASAFLPLLHLVGGAAWPRVYVALLLALTLLLFLSGAAGQLAQRQRHHPLRTLALGTLVFGPLAAVLLLLALGGLLAPTAAGSLVVLLAFSVGLAVSLLDAGRWVARQLHLPSPDAVGAALGLTAFGVSLEWAPLALTLWLVGGVWGAGTLLLSRAWERPARALGHPG